MPYRDLAAGTGPAAAGESRMDQAALRSAIEDAFEQREQIGPETGDPVRAAVQAVLDGQFDAGVTWTSGIGSYEEGHTRGNLHRMVQQGQLDMSDVRILWSSSLIAEGPVVVRKALPQEAKDAYRQLLLELPAQNRSCFESITGGSAAGYAPVEHELYRTIVEIRSQLEGG